MTIMNLISIAAAQSPAVGGAPPLAGMIPFILVFGVMMYVMYRSQKKQAKERETMLNTIKAGDEIITNGGIKGTITKVSDKSFFVRVAPKMDLEVVHNGVATVIKPEKDNVEGGEEEKK
ncbi:MAG: preprotein translocase subunit YajC [Kiritimatiellaeota bacterium]|nr:preprotein translocase subunit YajC [Kiritimatiellota bacterium]